MNITVCKFGGTSLCDEAQLKKVKDILLSDENRKIAVLSAPGKRFKDDIKITDLLYKCSDDEAFKKVVTRFYSIERELCLTHRASDYLIAAKDEMLKNVDFAASRGEYCSAMLFAEFINWEFVDAFSVIDIDENGKPLSSSYEKIKDKLIKGLDNGKRYVIPGFYGKSKNETVKTFTRGGSDITGSVVARGIGASLYENWSDVSGVMRANPKLVDNPEIIDTLSYSEMEHIAKYGAEVFHKDAVESVRNIIPINIRNTNSPNDNGTLITKENLKNNNNAICVSVKDKKAYVLSSSSVIESCNIEKDNDEKTVVNTLYKKYFKK